MQMYATCDGGRTCLVKRRTYTIVHTTARYIVIMLPQDGRFGKIKGCVLHEAIIASSLALPDLVIPHLHALVSLVHLNASFLSIRNGSKRDRWTWTRQAAVFTVWGHYALVVVYKWS